EGAESLADNLERLVHKIGRKPIIAVGALGAARAGPLINVVCRFARAVHLVVPRQARACSHAELRRLVPPDFAGEVTDSRLETLFGPGEIRCCEDGDVVVVTGSIYLAGEVLLQVFPETGPGEGRLQDF